MSGIIEAAGLTREEAVEWCGWIRPQPASGSPDMRCTAKLHAALTAELKAARPPEPGDVVSIPWQQERYEVVAVDGDELWAKDADGCHLTLAVDTCERIK